MFHSLGIKQTWERRLKQAGLRGYAIGLPGRLEIPDLKIGDKLTVYLLDDGKLKYSKNTDFEDRVLYKYKRKYKYRMVSKKEKGLSVPADWVHDQGIMQGYLITIGLDNESNIYIMI